MDRSVTDYLHQSGELGRTDSTTLRRLVRFYDPTRLPGNFATMLVNHDWEAIREHYVNLSLDNIYLGEVRYAYDRLQRYLFDNSLEVPEILEYIYGLEMELCRHQNQALFRYYDEYRRLTDQLVQEMEYHRKYGNVDLYEKLRTVDIHDYMDPHVIQQYYRHV